MESSDEWYLDSDYRSSLEVDYQFGCLMWVSLSLCECLSLSLSAGGMWSNAGWNQEQVKQ